MTENTEQQIQETIDMGAESQRVIDNKAFQKAFKVLSDMYSELWKQSAIDATEQREHLYRLNQILQDFESVFLIAINKGNAEIALMEAETLNSNTNS